MIQLRFMEELNFHGIEILFTNTDGTLVKCPKNKINEYHQVAIDIAKEFDNFNEPDGKTQNIRAR